MEKLRLPVCTTFAPGNQHGLNEDIHVIIVRWDPKSAGFTPAVEVGLAGITAARKTLSDWR